MCKAFHLCIRISGPAASDKACILPVRPCREWGRGRRVGSRRLLLLFLAMLLVGKAGLALAESLTLTPSLTLSEEYDDNVLLSPTDRQSDFVTTVNPGLRLTLKESPWTVTAAASLRAVYYGERSELNSSTDNRQGHFAIEFRPTPRLTASLSDTVVRSLDPGEVDPETGIITGRFASTRNSLRPAVSYQLNPLTRIHLQYAFTILRSDSTLVQESDTHEAGLSVERELTPRTSGTLRYDFGHFQTEDGPGRDAHLPAIGLVHSLSPTTQVAADAGPLVREKPDGKTEITLGGRVRYNQDFSRGRLSLSYDRSARVAGVRGEAAAAQTLRLNVNYRVGPAVTVALESGVTATREPEVAVDFLVYSAAIRVDYQLLRWLSVNAGYRHQSQDDRAGPLDIERNVIFIGLTASPDVPVY